MALKLSGLALAGLIGSTVLGYAASTSETVTSGPQTDWIGVLNFDGFNTALGSLNDITILATETIGGNLQVINATYGATYVSQATNQWDVFIDPSSEGIGLGVDPTTGDLGPVTTLSNNTNSNIVTDTPNASDYLSPHSLSGTSSAFVASIAGNDLSGFEEGFSLSAADTLEIPSVVATGAAYGEATGSTTGQITVTVTYDYTPVAEPISLTLFGVGMLGTAAVRRRRQS